MGAPTETRGIEMWLMVPDLQSEAEPPDGAQFKAHHLGWKHQLKLQNAFPAENVATATVQREVENMFLVNPQSFKT